jgi:hypothetical protein
MESVCKCGNTKDNPLVIAKTSYSWWGWLLLSMAISAKPKEVIFQCQNCGEIIGRSKDTALLEKYRYNSDILKR